MHAILALTGAHGRYIGTTTPLDCHNPARKIRETYHYGQSVALFQQKLLKPIEAQDRDSVWATACYMSLLVLSTLEASSPEQSWPFRPDDPSDLQWLRMCQGKAIIFQMTRPNRAGSIFATEFNFSPIPKMGAEGIPPALAALCELDESSTPENNPYFVAAHMIPRRWTYMTQVQFSLSMQASYVALLKQKDPRALLLLAYCQRASETAVWWTSHRSRVERESISLHLQQRYKTDSALLALLPEHSGV